MTMMLTDEQQMLDEALSRLLDGEGPGAGAEQLWPRLAGDLGLNGTAVPAEAGGMGGEAIDAGVVMAALGRGNARAPWLEHWVATRLLAAGSSALLPAALAGEARCALVTGAGLEPAAALDGAGEAVSGAVRMVAGAAGATHLLVPVADGLLVLPRDAVGLTVAPLAMADDSDAADVTLDGVALAAGEQVTLADAAALLGWAQDALILGRATETVGLAARMLSDTVAYANTRRQFGVAIASFQVLRHRMVDMKIALDKLEALAEAAWHALDGEAATRARKVSAAKHAANEAARIVGEGAVQIHGAMGLTSELALGSYFRRARVLAQINGSSAAHQARYARLTA